MSADFGSWSIMGLVYDILFVVLFLLLVRSGARQGFASGLLRLGGTALGIAGGVWASNVLARPLYRLYFGNTIGARVEEAMAGYGSSVNAGIDSLTFLPAPVRALLHDAVEGATEGVVPAVVDTLEPLILPLLQGLVFIVVCLAVRLVLRLLARSLRLVNRLPLLGGANKLLGGVLGAVTGLLDCWLLAMGLWLLSGVTAGGDLTLFSEQALAASRVYGFLANFNPFLAT